MKRKTAIAQIIDKMSELNEQNIEPIVQLLILRGFAEQMKTTERYQIESAFGDGLKPHRHNVRNRIEYFDKVLQQ